MMALMWGGVGHDMAESQSPRTRRPIPRVILTQAATLPLSCKWFDSFCCVNYMQRKAGHALTATSRISPTPTGIPPLYPDPPSKQPPPTDGIEPKVQCRQ